MGKQITWKNDLNFQYCQIRLDDGKRIIISVGDSTIRVSTLKWFGTFPDKKLFERGVDEVINNSFYQQILEKLSASGVSHSYGYNQLDVFRKALLPCKNLNEVRLLLNIFLSNHKPELPTVTKTNMRNSNDPSQRKINRVISMAVPPHLQEQYLKETFDLTDQDIEELKQSHLEKKPRSTFQ